MEEKIIIVKGSMHNCRFGKVTKKDKEDKYRFSIKLNPEDMTDSFYAQFEEVYMNMSDGFTPTWLKERNGYINQASLYDFKVELPDGSRIDYSEALKTIDNLNGSIGQFKLKLKEGSIYPVAVKLSEFGEESNLFEGFE